MGPSFKRTWKQSEIERNTRKNWLREKRGEAVGNRSPPETNASTKKEERRKYRYSKAGAGGNLGLPKGKIRRIKGAKERPTEIAQKIRHPIL